jgi:hypothetical protein
MAQETLVTLGGGNQGRGLADQPKDAHHLRDLNWKATPEVMNGASDWDEKANL